MPNSKQIINLHSRWWKYLLILLFILVMSGIAFLGIATALIYPTLPSLDALTDYRPKLPLRVYSEDGYLIREFGEEHRAFISIKDVPQTLKNAVIAIEDRRFYEHHGVDWKGVLRAAISNLDGGIKEGASTITMQVARNFFLSSDRNYTRKINEALLAIKIERQLGKDKILELYFNQVFLGQRAYGFSAASKTYFGKTLEKLSLAEVALLAGLPKSPSGYNPFTNPRGALRRQKEVLHDMHRYGYITDAAYIKALGQQLIYRTTKQSTDLSADYVAEIVRDSLYHKYGDEVYISGLKVYTTIRKINQEAANSAVSEGLLEYDLRHGYRGPERVIGLANISTREGQHQIKSVLEEVDEFGGYVPAIVTAITRKGIHIYIKGGYEAEITGQGLSLVASTIKQKNPSKNSLKIGALVRVLKKNNRWQIAQLPQVEAALISLNPKNGAVLALVGGFDFNRTKFNHVTQAWRQPGSSFKPFIYSAALEKGYTPATLVEDAPLHFSASETGDKEWSPKNYESVFDGPVSIRYALAKSINTVAIRVLQSIDVNYAQNYITRFGFSARNVPAYSTMALGAGSATPWQMAAAYSVFANGGYRVQPNLISKIVDKNGKIILESKFDDVEKNAPRVIDARNAFIMNSMMQSVVREGTATKALQLGRSDIAGKTGTTNDQLDAWFAGYNPNQVAVSWVGFDRPKTLGKGETGAVASLPIWMKYMAIVLKNTSESRMPVPDGVDTINIDSTTGVRDGSGIAEYFYHEYPPLEITNSPSSLFEKIINLRNTQKVI